jgi:hypothetical protein
MIEAAAAKAMNLRISRRKQTRRVLVHGLLYFAPMFAELMNGDGWDFRYWPDSGIRNLAAIASELRSCDIAYQIGGRVTIGKFLRAAKFMKKQRIVMHWAGSDALDDRQHVANGKADPWVMRKIHHWAVSPWMAREVEAFGAPCEMVPLPSAHVPRNPSPLPAEFSVLVYMPDLSRGALYGLDQILRVARELVHIRFDLVGLLRGTIPDPPPNLRVHGRIPNLREFYERASVVWRPVRHDGLSCMVMEALGHGRHVLWTYPFPGCQQVASASEAIEEILRLHALHRRNRLTINHAGTRAMVEHGYMPLQLRSMIHERLESLLEC